MTLQTNVLIIEPTDPRAIFDHCMSLLADDDKPRWTHQPASAETEARYLTESGQGLAAWLFVHYATDGPLRFGDEEVGPPIEHCVRIAFDTVYSYRTPTGAGCEDLHAWLVQELGRWLTDRGVTHWIWQHESSGKWFGQDDPVTHLGDPDRGRLTTGGTR